MFSRFYWDVRKNDPVLAMLLIFIVNSNDVLVTHLKIQPVEKIVYDKKLQLDLKSIKDMNRIDHW